MQARTEKALFSSTGALVVTYVLLDLEGGTLVVTYVLLDLEGALGGSRPSGGGGRGHPVGGIWAGAFTGDKEDDNDARGFSSQMITFCSLGQRCFAPQIDYVIKIPFQRRYFAENFGLVRVD